jgi:hypothetical protein
MGAVDEALVAQGRLRILEAAASFVPVRRQVVERPPLREPALMLDLLLAALG